MSAETTQAMGLARAEVLRTRHRVNRMREELHIAETEARVANAALGEILALGYPFQLEDIVTHARTPGRFIVEAFSAERVEAPKPCLVLICWPATRDGKPKKHGDEYHFSAEECTRLEAGS